MDPKMLIGPSSAIGFPAPFWFLVTFKVLGFTLHMAPMHLWFAGILCAMWMRWRGSDHARRLGTRLMKQMPLIVAYGVNFGIVPLLFTQVVYHRVFYPATILMAWPWFAIVILLTFAYYGVYVYGLELWKNSPRAYLKDYIGWAAAGLFLVIGFIFSNGFSLMANVGAWPDIWQKTSVAGAPLGIGHNMSDPTLAPRWLMMFGLALTTTAAYIVLDTGYFAIGEKPEYKQWASGFAPRLYALGVVWFLIAGVWYSMSWTPGLRQALMSGTNAVFSVLALALIFAPLALIFAQSKGITKPMALLTVIAQYAVIALNAVARQIKQNVELSGFLDVNAEPVHTQWSSLIPFLLITAVGVFLMTWMIKKALQAARQPAKVKAKG